MALYTFLISLGGFFVFLIDRRPVRKSFFKTLFIFSLFIYLVEVGGYLSSKYTLSEEYGCIEEYACGRGCRVKVKHGERLAVYEISSIDNFYTRKEYLGNCYLISSYRYLFKDYIHSIKDE